MKILFIIDSVLLCFPSNGIGRAEIEHGTSRVIRFSGLANSTAVVNQDVGKPAPTVLGQKRSQILFNFVGVLVFRQAQSTGKPFHMGIHHDPRHIKNSTQNTVGGFSAYPRQFDQFGHAGRHFSTVSIHESLAASLDGLGLVPEKPGGPDIHFQFTDGDGQKIIGGQVFPEQDLGDAIHLLVGTLGREDGADEQLKGRLVFESGLFPRIKWVQNFKNVFCSGGPALFTFHNPLLSTGLTKRRLRLPSDSQILRYDALVNLKWISTAKPPHITHS